MIETMNEKDIRFTQKKVDESWKEQASRDRDKENAKTARPEGSPHPNTAKTSKAFVNLLTSLGYQAMMHLGESGGDPSAAEENIQLAKEVIDLLGVIKEKTQGNLSAEESRLLESLIPELQMKFAQKV